MSNIRDIKRRIRAVSNIQHVTGAMKMVAAAKLRRAQGRLWAARPYAQKITEVAGRLALAPNAQMLPLTTPREVKKTSYVLIVGERGLAGAYNANLIHLTENCIGKEKKPVALVIVGRKGVQFFRQRSVEILNYYIDIGDDPGLSQARQLAGQLMEIFLNGKVDEINLVYARFYSALHHVPQVERLLPIQTPSLKQVERILTIFTNQNPCGAEAILPRYCETKYQALLEAKASELGARMVAMEGATRNSSEMIDNLTLSFNKARQTAITTELGSGNWR